jgi:tetratricopeptide (TPR) repeat protein
VSAEYKYRAFISYSHKDEKWASWLHKALETFRVPKYIVGRDTPMGKVPARMGKVFRDREELSSSHSLGSELTQALADSACQIVICSPNAAHSHWTNEEILTYKKLGRENRIFCLIVDGEPGTDEECFPPAVRFKMGADGILSDQLAEPIAADARPHADGKLNAKLKLIAGMLGVGFDALKRREQHRRQKRLVYIATAAIAGMVITSGLATMAVLARNEANVQRQQAEIEAERARQTTDFLVGLFAVSDPNEAQGNTITARELLDKGTSRIDTELAEQPATQAILMETIGKVYRSLALYPPAASLLESALEKRRELYGEDHIEIARTAHELGSVLKLTAEYEPAQQMYRDALRIRQKLLGTDSADVAGTLYELADLLDRMGEYEQAEQLYRQALATQRHLLGDENAAVANSLQGLALNRYYQSSYADALSLMRESLAMQRKLHTEPHTELAEALNELGFLLGEVGEYYESEQLFREALAMKRFLLGDTHTEIALGLNNIAFALHDQQKYDDAEVMYREAITIQHKLLGEDHPEIADSLNNLAFLLYDKGDLDVARSMMRESLDMYRRTVGEEHPSVARAMGNLAMWQMEDGDYGAAEPLLIDAVTLRRKLLGPEHTDVAGSLTLLASLLIDTGRYEEALPVAREAKAICLLSLAENHWRTAGAASAEGAALAGLGELDTAEPLLVNSVDILQNDSGALRFFVDNATRWLASFHEKQVDLQRSAQHQDPLNVDDRL